MSVRSRAEEHLRFPGLTKKMLCSSAPLFQQSRDLVGPTRDPSPCSSAGPAFQPLTHSRIIQFSLSSLVFFSNLLVISQPVFPVSLESPGRISPLSQEKVQSLKKKKKSGQHQQRPNHLASSFKDCSDTLTGELYGHRCISAFGFYSRGADCLD